MSLPKPLPKNVDLAFGLYAAAFAGFVFDSPLVTGIPKVPSLLGRPVVGAVDDSTNSFSSVFADCAPSVPSP